MMGHLRLDFPAPLNLFAARAITAFHRRANRFSSPSPSLCTISPSATPTCQSNPALCAWFSTIASALLPPANARARDDSNPLDALLTDLADQADPAAAPGKKQYRVPATANPPADRVIAIGDVHGDLTALRTALRSADVIDDKDSWIGGQTVLVQVGDQLDRGERERDIYSLLFHLQDTAPSSGGAVHILLGNHELMNASLDFRYVTRGGFDDFTRATSKTLKNNIPTHAARRRSSARINATSQRTIRQLPSEMRARARAIVAGGDLAAELAERAAVSVIVGDSLFVHAGFAPRHLRVKDGSTPPTDAQGRGKEVSALSPTGVKIGRVSEALRLIDSLNVQTRNFLRGQAPLPSVLKRGDGPVWMRDYSRPGVRAGSSECRMLADTLRLAGVKRMVVGHTPQANGINSACGGKVWRIDTGMSKAYGGVPEAIEISRRGNVKVYTAKGVVQGSARFK